MNDLVASVYVGIDAKEVQVHPDIAKQNMNNKIPVQLLHKENKPEILKTEKSTGCHVSDKKLMGRHIIFDSKKEHKESVEAAKA